MKSEYIIYGRIMRLTITFVLENLSKTISHEDIAAACRTNKYTYVRLFKKELIQHLSNGYGGFEPMWQLILSEKT